MFVPRSGTRAVSCDTSRPNVERAITTDAGPQLFSDCQTCFISGMTRLAGAAFTSIAGAGSAAAGAAREATSAVSATVVGGISTEDGAEFDLDTVASAAPRCN